MSKYIFVTGGVCSSLGKGLSASSIGSLLESRNFTVCMIKIDPYLNVDAGTMNPFQHGEVYVTPDGAETDLDLGNYGRFTSSDLSANHSITTGQIYQKVIQKERMGNYLGKCVQVVPHITDEIKRRIYLLGDRPGVDVTIIEVGGTVGDIESIPFLEAARQIIHEQSHQNAICVHLTLLPETSSGELKTKPTQHSVKELLETGIQPDFLLCRSSIPVPEELRKKIALFTNIPMESVFSSYDVDDIIYEIPLIYYKQKVDEAICSQLNLPLKKADIRSWKNVVKSYKNSHSRVRIVMVGKYVDLEDSYKSIDEAVFHGGLAQNTKIDLIKVNAEALESPEKSEELLGKAHGILIPGGFGVRGINGMVNAARYTRENKIPYLGICLGMQIMVIEYGRNVLGWADANSTEFDPETGHPLISLLEEQVDIAHYGGTMRLGENKTFLEKNSRIERAYGQEEIQERHRHRYEVSNRYKKLLEEGGLKITGYTANRDLVESVEWPKHPWSTGVQFHPEFTSQPIKPHPLFSAFVKAALDCSRCSPEKSS